MKSDLARREFLKRLGLGLGAGLISGTALHRLTGEILKSAVAGTAPASGLNPVGYYLYMDFPGGPPRWLFDLPLTPNGPAVDGFVSGAFGTAIETVSGNSRAVYASKAFTIGGRKVYLPPVWGMDIAGAGKSTDVLQNAVMIRGMNNRINAHDVSSKQQLAPVFGGTSLNAAFSDGSNRPIPGLIDPTSSAAKAYRSAKGLYATEIEYSDKPGKNPATSLLDPFKSWYGSREVHTDQARALQSQALAQFEQFAVQRGLASSRIGAMYDNAIQLVDQNIFALAEQWPTTLAKYQRLVDLALHPAKGSLDGLYDSRIVSTTADDPRMAMQSDESIFVTLSDKRDMITSAYSAPRMAENFALAELVLDKLTCSMSLAFRGCENIVLADNGKMMNVTHDQHHIGSVISTVATTLFYRAFIACLNEYVGVLKTQGLFDQTMIHIAAEFSRVPIDSGGTGHGASASNSTLISGKIKDFSIIGNVDTSSRYGTYGVAAPFAVGKSGSYDREIEPKDVARSIALTMGVQDVTTNGMTLLTPDSGGKWSPTFGEAKNVKS